MLDYVMGGWEVGFQEGTLFTQCIRALRFEARRASKGIPLNPCLRGGLQSK
jgi:hypothetical protein